MENPFIISQGQKLEFGEGIYFGLPEDQYHLIPALSSSGMKNLLVSAPDFYFNSYLNPLRDEDQEDDDKKEWRRFGKASHVRILEGKTIFDELYCVEFIAPEGCLDTVADLKAYLDQNGVTYKKSSPKPELIAAVQFHNANALIFDVEKQKYGRETKGRIQLSAKEIRRIEIAAAMIEKHPELKHFFVGGHPEVSVIWHHDGLWFKARFDYLKPRAIVDLKTFTNMQNKPIDSALYNAMAGLKYHIQVRHYIEGAKKAVEFAQRGLTTTYSVHRYGPTAEFMDQLREAKAHEFFFCFQKKGGAPLARGKKFSKHLNMMACADASIEHAIALYKKYFALYGTGIWVDDSSISEFEDGLFPTWATEI